MSIHTEMRCIRGPGFCMDMGPEPFLLRDGSQEWLVEWHPFGGPAHLSKRTQDPLRNQPGPRSRFWKVAQWWYDQGAKVVDGVGVWKEPPPKLVKCRKIARGHYEIVPDCYAGDDVVLIDVNRFDVVAWTR